MGTSIGFHGGAGTVTGSKHLVDTGESRVQVDCGMFQGLKELRLLNWRKPPYDPASVDHVLLTHAHIDHSGILPRFCKDGFRGPVHCTPATKDLAGLLMLDSAKIQEQDAEYANKKGYSKHRPALPLFTKKDAEVAFERIREADWNEWIDVGPGARARFVNVGHILGAGFVEMRVARGDRELTIVFSGDVGRYDMPLHVDPQPCPPCDVLVVESTYGDRVHEHDPVEEQVAEPFAATFARGGVVVIPSFAVGRAQQVILILRNMMNDGLLPEVPIHLDSPMAVNATRIYSKHLNEHNLDAELLEDGRNRLFPENVHFHGSVAESKALNAMSGPRIIISSSGMLSGGRILHHLKKRLPHGMNLVVLVGYQAAGTRGRALLEGRRWLRIHGNDIPVRAEFMSLAGMSGHADKNELMRWVKSSGQPPKVIFVVHGEPGPAQTLARRFRRDLGCKTFVPRLDDTFDIDELVP